MMNLFLLSSRIVESSILWLSSWMITAIRQYSSTIICAVVKSNDSCAILCENSGPYRRISSFVGVIRIIVGNTNHTMAWPIPIPNHNFMAKRSIIVRPNNNVARKKPSTVAGRRRRASRALMVVAPYDLKSSGSNIPRLISSRSCSSNVHPTHTSRLDAQRVQSPDTPLRACHLRPYHLTRYTRAPMRNTTKLSHARTLMSITSPIVAKAFATRNMMPAISVIDTKNNRLLMRSALGHLRLGMLQRCNVSLLGIK